MVTAGDRGAAEALYREVASWPLSGDGDYETWPVMRAIAERSLRSSPPSSGP